MNFRVRLIAPARPSLYRLSRQADTYLGGRVQKLELLIQKHSLTSAAIMVALGLTAFALLAHDHSSSGVAAGRSEQNITLGLSNPLVRLQPGETPAPLVVAPNAVPAASPYRFIWPADYPLVQGMWAGHPLGIDIGAPYGTPVKATADGRVIFAGGDTCCNYGFFVIVEHANGYSSLYGHFSRIDVKYGDVVKQGQSLGLSGDTGKASGPHIHFELRLNGGVVNPLDYLEPSVDWSPTADLIAELNNKNGDGSSQQAGPGPAPVAAGEAAAPTPLGGHLDSATAMLLGANWLAHQDSASYDIDPTSCVAAQSGPNFWVTCNGNVQGCRGQACARQLTVCVFDQPRLFAASCP